MVPDHLVQELLGALWLALWRDRSHFDRATHSAALSSGAGRLLLLRTSTYRGGGRNADVAQKGCLFCWMEEEEGGVNTVGVAKPASRR